MKQLERVMPMCRRSKCCPVLVFRTGTDGKLKEVLIGEEPTGIATLTPQQWEDFASRMKEGEYDAFLPQRS